MIKILNEEINDLNNYSTDEEINESFYEVKSCISKKIDEIVDDYIEDLLKRKRNVKETICKYYIGNEYFRNGYLEIPEDEDAEEKLELINSIKSLIDEYNNIDSNTSALKDDIFDELGINAF